MGGMGYFKALRRAARFRIAAALGGGRRPGKLRLAVTQRCSARCIMCNVWKAEGEARARANELTVEEYERLFGENAAFLSRLSHVSLTGGEPTLRTDLIDILRAVLRRHPRISLNLNTNAFNTAGLLRFVEAAAAETRRLTVMVSLDGMGEAHDRIRGIPGAFGKTMRSIEEMLELRSGGAPLRVSLNHMLTRENYREFEKVWAFAQEHDLEVTPIVMQQGEFFANEDLDLSLDAESTEHLTGVFEKLIARPRQATLKHIEVLEQLQGRPRDYGCWAGRTLLLLEEQGDVYPNGGCPADWNLGNLREADFNLESIVRSTRARDVLGRVRDCRRCRLACETLTTLRGPEALAGYRKLKQHENHHR